MKVLGMGNALVDVLVKINDDEVLERMNLPKGSMQLIDKEKKNQLDTAIANLEKHIASGGSASNTISGISQLGVKTGFLGKIGDDFYGNYYREDLEKHGVKPHLILSDEASGIATTFISTDGERTFGTFLGVAAELCAENLKAEYFAGYDFFYIEGYLVQNLDLIRTAMQMAKQAGAKVVLDLASYNVVEENRDFLLEVIPQYVDIIFANEEEAKAFFGTDAEDALNRLAEITEIAIVKVGSKGSFVKRGNEKAFVPALKVDKVVDTTGAGDLYAAGFLYGLIEGLPLDKCGRIGTLLAGNVIQVVGAKITDQQWNNIKHTLKEILL
ncbi:sugar/nucleoside kinase (ribokinase family) [Dysgonomonas sp. PH5-45]|nr:sugar/nucleoside kinase (ribokinase family) [Dysgonomonas sp. PH5-45]MDH6388723.1 sugar/nucleoside kinase (ribokinase family) [Dysgonomonas sp. PH5-37]